MAGFVIDIFIAWLFKSLIRGFQYVQSSNWHRKEAKVLESTLLKPAIGCSSAKVRYKILESGVVASDEIPFYMHWHAVECVEDFFPGGKITVRVDPRSPDRSYLFEWDQTGS
jgi:hypothetical protein